MYTWYKVVAFTDLQDNAMKEFTVHDKRIGLLKREGQVYAFAALCPHAGGNLCEGRLDARGRIICPVHSYRFDPATGRNTTGEGYKLFTYPVEIKDNEIFVGLLSS